MVCPASQSSPSKGLTGDRWKTDQSIGAVRNGEVLRKVRQSMLAGRLPEEVCSRCLSEERAGLPSWRMKTEATFKATDEELRTATGEDGGIEVERLPLQQLSLRLSNKCNLQCQMCHPSSSRALYEEWVALEKPRFGVGGEKVELIETESGWREKNSPFSWFDDFFARMKAEPGVLREIGFIHFSGGEPLLETNHLAFLEELIRQGRAPHLTLDYTSNLTVLPEAVLKAWTRFGKVRVSVSWDGRRSAQEYIRFPMKYERFLRNVRRLDEAEGPFELWVNSTISILNVWDYPLFLREFMEHGFRRYNVLLFKEGPRFYPSFHVLRKPEIFSLDRISAAGKERLRAHYQEQRGALEGALRARGWSSEELGSSLQGVIDSIRPSSTGEGDLRETLRNRDRFRKMKYQDFIPELEFLMEEA